MLYLLFICDDKRVSSFLVVRLTGLDHVIENYQNAVTNSHNSLFSPSSRTDPTILFAKVRLGMPCCMRRLDEHRFGPAIPLTRATTELLASRFMIAWTDADPGSCVRSVWEVTHILAQFAEQDFDAASRESRHRIKPLDEGIKLV